MKVIMGENLKQPIEDLKIKASMRYKGKEYEIWELQDKDLETMDNIPQEEWDNKWWNNHESWWISSDKEDPLNMGVTNAIIEINNFEIKAWVDYQKLLFEYDEDRESTNFCDYISDYINKNSLTEYLEVELGLTNPENIFALSLVLAKENKMSVAELFDKYEGDNQVKIENWVSEVDPSDDEYWHPDFEGNTREEVIEKAMEYIKGDGTERNSFRIGVKVPVLIPTIDADLVIEELQGKLDEEIGEISEDFLEGVNKEQYKELEDSLNEVVINWINKHNLDPSYFTIVKEEVIKLNK